MRLLIVYPYAFGTIWAGATARIFHMAAGLKAHGWQVDLLRCRQANEAALQEVVDSFPGRVVTLPFNGHYPELFNRKGARSLYRAWLKLHGIRPDDDPGEGLVRRMTSRAVGRKLVEPPDVIWGITVGFLTGPVGAQRFAEHFRCPFVVEFQDPVPHPGRGPLPEDRRKILDACLARAALVVTTTDGITGKVESDYPVAKGKTRTYYLSYDDVPPAPTAPRAAEPPLVLVHAGVLYGGEGRNARSLVQAVAEAEKLDPAVAGKIRIRLIGAGAGGTEAVELARSLGIPGAVEDVPQMSSKACLAEMDKSDVLVVIKFDDAEYDLQVPGKVFQYLGRGKPILGLMRETESARLIRGSGLGVIHANADVAGLARTLVDYWRNRQTLATRYEPNWDYIRQFSCPSFGERLHRDLSALRRSGGAV